MLSLSGPSQCEDRSRLPLRGDLAHIRLAGRCFVPHYAVPMPHRAQAGAVLMSADSDTAEVIAVLTEGAVFHVLDISGGWAWGQYGENGPVGYVALSALDPVMS
ncbi:hypothetical protein B2G71_10185 [Novosphingobium sp. PC22D]|nr:hypothetical protein B2G71_10185 [Novosphingobium sp. PC22D]